MKKGSLYHWQVINALLRYHGEGQNEKLKIETDGNIVYTGEYMSPPLNNLLDHELWSIPPLKRRTYTRGELVLLLRNGAYTIAINEHMIFSRMMDSDRCELLFDLEPGYRTILTHIGAIRPAKYMECYANCKMVVICWLLMSKELRLPRDMRRLIGETIWETRDDREWENQK